jgi:hypothetical protein
VQEKVLSPVLISDIDNTIAFLNPDVPTPRLPHDFSRSEEDTPNQNVIGLVKAWYSLTEDPRIYFVTNRDVKWRDVTIRWLIKLFPPASYKWTLRMRPNDDLFSSAAGIKEGHLVNEIMKYYSVQQVWEDDPDCITMYRLHDLVVMDAKETWGSA